MKVDITARILAEKLLAIMLENVERPAPTAPKPNLKSGK